MAEFTVELPDELLKRVGLWAEAGQRPASVVVGDLLRTGMRWNVGDRPPVLATLDPSLLDPEALQTMVIDFLTTEVDAFVDAHPGEVLCSLALDTNLDYGQVLISANTDELFDRRVEEYQSGPFADRYRSEEAIRRLRTNVGDWGYTCIAELTLFDESQIEEIQHALGEDSQDLWEILTDELMDVIAAALVRFRATDVFRRVPKTRNFESFCIDHDDTYDDARLRMIRVSQRV